MRPEEGLTDAVNVTGPLKWLRPASDSVELIDCPAFTVALATLEDKLKSTTLTMKDVEWEIEPRLAVTVTL